MVANMSLFSHNSWKWLFHRNTEMKKSTNAFFYSMYIFCTLCSTVPKKFIAEKAIETQEKPSFYVWRATYSFWYDTLTYSYIC